jgi:hypothetical protein
MNNFSAVFLVPLLMLGLTACGGNGDGDSSGGDSIAPVGAITIDRDNAKALSSVALASINGVRDLDVGGILPAQGPADPVTKPESAADHASKRQSKLEAAQASALIASPIIPCLVSGSFQMTADVTDEFFSTLTPGDVLTGEFQDCDDDLGLVLDGLMTIAVITPVDVSFTPPYDFTFDLTMTEFAATTDSETTVVNGDLTISETTNDGAFYETELKGKMLDITIPQRSAILRDFRILETYNTVDNQYTSDISGQSDCCAILESKLLGGSVTVENTLAFAGIGNASPSAGVLMMTGATMAGGSGPSTVELVVLDAVCVNLQVDENGDDELDADIVVSWESLATGIDDDACST